MTTKFIHIRSYRVNGPLLEHVINERGGTTIAYDFNPETRMASFAVAHCSKKDNYCKAIGRAIAGGRLKSVIYRFVHVPEGESVAQTIVDNLAA